MVEHLGTGLLYDPANPLGLVDAVAAVVADPSRRLLGTHARELVSQRTWRDAVDELVRRALRRAARRPAPLAA